MFVSLSWYHWLSKFKFRICDFMYYSIFIYQVLFSLGLKSAVENILLFFFACTYEFWKGGGGGGVGGAGLLLFFTDGHMDRGATCFHFCIPPKELRKLNYWFLFSSFFFSFGGSLAKARQGDQRNFWGEKHFYSFSFSFKGDISAGWNIWCFLRSGFLMDSDRSGTFFIWLIQDRKS